MRIWKARFDTTRNGRFVQRDSDIRTSATETLDPELFDLVDGPPVEVKQQKEGAGGGMDPVNDALKLAEARVKATAAEGSEAGPADMTDGEPGQDAGQKDDHAKGRGTKSGNRK